MAQPQDSIRRRMIRVFAALAAVLVAVYVVKGVALYAFQRKFLYPEPGRVVGTPASYGLPYVRAVTTKTQDGLALQAWFMPPGKTGRVVVYFHGNGDDLSVTGAVAPIYHQHGYGLLTCEYRGYSGNPGEPTEQGVYSDARACLSWLKDHGYETDKLVLHGHSLGTGVAVQMATEIHPKILILESAFTDLGDVAGEKYPYYPVHLMIKDPYDSLSKIGAVKTALLMVHGAQDDLVPITMGRKVFGAANEPKTFVEIKDGGHNDLYNHGGDKIIADWLDKQMTAEKSK